MIRVLHYGMSPNLGGIETYLLNLARTIDSSRYQFDFLFSDQGQLPVFASDLPGSRFFGVTPRRRSPGRNKRDLADLFANEQFDILHFHANTASYVEPVQAALRHGVRVVFHSHNTGASRSRITQLLHYWNRRTMPWRSISRVAVSSEAGRWMFGGMPFEVVHNGIDVEAFAFQPKARESLRAEWGVDRRSLLLGHVGAFLPAKNHSFVIDVFREVAKLRSDSRLVLVGSGPEEQRIRELAAVTGLENRVLFLGRRSDIPEVMSALDCFLFPSLHEGFGLVALEAQASGLRVIASDRVPRDALVTDLCLTLPLEAEVTSWAAATLSPPQPADRSAAAETVAHAGMSKNAVADRITDVYRRVVG